MPKIKLYSFKLVLFIVGRNKFKIKFKCVFYFVTELLIVVVEFLSLSDHSTSTTNVYLWSTRILYLYSLKHLYFCFWYATYREHNFWFHPICLGCDSEVIGLLRFSALMIGLLFHYFVGMIILYALLIKSFSHWAYRPLHGSFHKYRYIHTYTPVPSDILKNL